MGDLLCGCIGWVPRGWCTVSSTSRIEVHPKWTKGVQGLDNCGGGALVSLRVTGATMLQLSVAAGTVLSHVSVQWAQTGALSKG